MVPHIYVVIRGQLLGVGSTLLRQSVSASLVAYSKLTGLRFSCLCLPSCSLLESLITNTLSSIHFKNSSSFYSISSSKTTPHSQLFILSNTSLSGTGFFSFSSALAVVECLRLSSL